MYKTFCIGNVQSLEIEVCVIPCWILVFQQISTVDPGHFFHAKTFHEHNPLSADTFDFQNFTTIFRFHPPNDLGIYLWFVQSSHLSPPKILQLPWTSIFPCPKPPPLFTAFNENQPIFHLEGDGERVPLVYPWWMQPWGSYDPPAT